MLEALVEGWLASRPASAASPTSEQAAQRATSPLSYPPAALRPWIRLVPEAHAAAAGSRPWIMVEPGTHVAGDQLADLLRTISRTPESDRPARVVLDSATVEGDVQVMGTTDLSGVTLSFTGTRFIGELWLHGDCTRVGAVKAEITGDLYLGTGLDGAVQEIDLNEATVRGRLAVGGRVETLTARHAHFPSRAAFELVGPSTLLLGGTDFGSEVILQSQGPDGSILLGEARFRGSFTCWMDGGRTFDATRARFEAAGDLGQIQSQQIGLDHAVFDRHVSAEAQAETVDLRGVSFAGGANLLISAGELSVREASFGRGTSIGILNANDDPTPRRPALADLASTDCAGLSLSGFDVRQTAFSGAHNLDKLRLDGVTEFPLSPPASLDPPFWPRW